MYIQYIGFNVAASSRIYNFDVIDKAEEGTRIHRQSSIRGVSLGPFEIPGWPRHLF